MASMTTIKRFMMNPVAQSLGITGDDVQRALAKWHEPHRHYHGLSHLFKLLKDMDEMLEDHDGAINDDMLPELELVALFHDIVYDPKSKTNEIDSAEYFSRFDDHSEVYIRIRDAILDTNYSEWREPSSEMSGTFRCLDWDILYTSSFYDLLQSEKKIMREYQYVSYPEYVKNRVDFIEYAIEKMDSSCYNEEGLLELKVWIEHHRPNIGVYAGSFKPFHIGHLNILEQAERVFDKVIILSADNVEKPDCDSYVAQLKRTLPFHEVEITHGLTTSYLDCVREYANVTLVRGLRNGYDLQYETNLRRFMTDISPEVEVAYFLSGTAYQHISSSDLRALEQISEPDCKMYIPTKYSYYKS